MELSSHTFYAAMMFSIAINVTLFGYLSINLIKSYMADRAYAEWLSKQEGK